MREVVFCNGAPTEPNEAQNLHPGPWSSCTAGDVLPSPLADCATRQWLTRLLLRLNTRISLQLEGPCNCDARPPPRKKQHVFDYVNASARKEEGKTTRPRLREDEIKVELWAGGGGGAESEG